MRTINSVLALTALRDYKEYPDIKKVNLLMKLTLLGAEDEIYTSQP